MQKNDLIRKIRLISKFLKSEPGKQTIVIHILSNISKSKSNQVLKIDQLKNMKNIFLKKSYTKSGRKTIFKPFSKISKLSIYPNQ